MRSPKILTTSVDALNKLLDANPTAMQSLMALQVPLNPAPSDTPSSGPFLTVMDVINAVVGAVADGKEIATSWSGSSPHGDSQLCGFAERRTRRSVAQSDQAGTPPVV